MKYVSVNCQSSATEAVMKPETPPMTNSMMKPAKNRKGVVNCGLPVQIVAIHAKTAMALGMAMTKLAALKNDSDMTGRPVANMWWTQTPKPRIMVATVEMATSVYPTSGRRQKTGSASETIPIAGRTTA